MRKLIVGDTHGDLEDFRKLFQIAAERECLEIHVVGDFGYFPNLPQCRAFLEYVSEMSLSSGIHVSFTDGNHENHHVLKDLFDRNETEDIFVMPGIEWKFRGKYWENILSIGGAYSIDKDRRILGVDYFENETISMNDFYRCDKESDIIFSHDCPLGIDFGFKSDFKTKVNRNTLLNIVEFVKPKILIHGHYHFFHDSVLNLEYGSLRIIGLDRNGSDMSNHCVVLSGNDVEFF